MHICIHDAPSNGICLYYIYFLHYFQSLICFLIDVLLNRLKVVKVLIVEMKFKSTPRSVALYCEHHKNLIKYPFTSQKGFPRQKRSH